MAKRKLSQSKNKKLERCIKSVKKTKSRKKSPSGKKRFSGVRSVNPWAVCKASIQRRKSLKKSFSTNKR